MNYAGVGVKQLSHDEIEKKIGGLFYISQSFHQPER